MKTQQCVIVEKSERPSRRHEYQRRAVLAPAVFRRQLDEVTGIGAHLLILRELSLKRRPYSSTRLRLNHAQPPIPDAIHYMPIPCRLVWTPVVYETLPGPTSVRLAKKKCGHCFGRRRPWKKLRDWEYPARLCKDIAVLAFLDAIPVLRKAIFVAEHPFIADHFLEAPHGPANC